MLTHLHLHTNHSGLFRAFPGHSGRFRAIPGLFQFMYTETELRDAIQNNTQ